MLGMEGETNIWEHGVSPPRTEKEPEGERKRAPPLREEVCRGGLEERARGVALQEAVHDYDGDDYR